MLNTQRNRDTTTTTSATSTASDVNDPRSKPTQSASEQQQHAQVHALQGDDEAVRNVRLLQVQHKVSEGSVGVVDVVKRISAEQHCRASPGTAGSTAASSVSGQGFASAPTAATSGSDQKAAPSARFRPQRHRLCGRCVLDGDVGVVQHAAEVKVQRVFVVSVGFGQQQAGHTRLKQVSVVIFSTSNQNSVCFSIFAKFVSFPTLVAPLL
jgi:hypothetical protein